MSMFADAVDQLSDKQRRVVSHLLARLDDSAQISSDEKPLLAAFVAPASDADLPDTAEIRTYLEQHLPAHMIPDVVVGLDALPSLPNGKVDRRALASLPLPERTADLGIVKPETEIEERLAAIWSEILNIDPISIHDNFFELGGDSIVSIQLVSRARQAGLAIEPRYVADHPTIAELARAVTLAKAKPGEPEVSATLAPALPVQNWFLDRDLAVPQHWNQSRLFEVDLRLAAEDLRSVLQACFDTHDGLKATFRNTGDGWKQTVPPDPEPVPITEIVLETEDSEKIGAQAALDHAALSLDGPLVRCVLFRFNDGRPSQLLIVAHHLGIDAVSWRVFLDDLNRAAELCLAGDPITLPHATSSLNWANRLARYAASDAARADVAVWQVALAPDAAAMPRDEAFASATEAEAITAIVFIDEGTASKLQGAANQAFNTQPLDLMLAALIQTLADWTGRQQILIDLEGHGREALGGDVDLARTVGWLTSYFPAWFELADQRGVEDIIKTVKESGRRFSGKGLSFGAVRYLSPDRDLVNTLTSLPAADVLFNYLGNMRGPDEIGGIFREIGTLEDAARAGANLRSHALEFNVSRSGDGLQVALTYSPNLHRAETAGWLLESFCQNLQSVVEHCVNAGAGNFTPSDFPEASMSQSELDSFLDGL